MIELGLVYANSFFVTINARKRLGSKSDDVSQMFAHIPQSFLSSEVSSSVATKVPREISIRVDTQKAKARDAVRSSFYSIVYLACLTTIRSCSALAMMTVKAIWIWRVRRSGRHSEFLPRTGRKTQVETH